MHPILMKTLGGLSKAYYVRQLMFGLIFPVLILLMLNSSHEKMHISFYLMAFINTLLYPYSRFVYESVINFIMGNNIFFVNAIFILFIKFFTMALCWGLAMFVAPIGLIYLYYWHSKEQHLA